MSKKDFSSVNTNPVYNAIDEATEQPAADPAETTRKKRERTTYSDAELQEFLAMRKTTGRKGAKLPRINLAFSPANYEFIKVMAQVRGESMTDFINEIVSDARETHADIYHQAIRFRNSL